jgi:hypothetical protein
MTLVRSEDVVEGERQLGNVTRVDGRSRAGRRAFAELVLPCSLPTRGRAPFRDASARPRLANAMDAARAAADFLRTNGSVVDLETRKEAPKSLYKGPWKRARRDSNP